MLCVGKSLVLFYYFNGSPTTIHSVPHSPTNQGSAVSVTVASRIEYKTKTKTKKYLS